MITDILLGVIVLEVFFQSYQLYMLSKIVGQMEPSTVVLTREEYEEAQADRHVDLVPSYDQLFESYGEDEDGADAE